MICATCGLDRPHREFIVRHATGRPREVKWCASCRLEHAGRVAQGPRAQGTNPRALGTNPRALGTNPRAARALNNEEPPLTLAQARAAWRRARGQRRRRADLARLIRNWHRVDPERGWTPIPPT